MSLKKWRIVVLIVLVAISLLIVACSKGEVTDSGTKMESPTDSPTEGTAMGVGEKESKTTTEDTIRHGASKDRAVDENCTSGNQQISAGQLTAGEWNDLRNWDWWVRLLNNKEWAQYQDRWGFYTFKKLQVIVKDGQKTVSDVKVVLYDKQGHVLWSAKTNNKGVAELFTELYDRNQNTVFDLVIENGQNRKKIENVKLSLSEPHYVEFNQRGEESNILDLMFVIDTTGSMHDELDYLKAELKNVILRINEDSSDLDIRLSCNYYRDHGDEYVVRSFPFTKKIDEVIKQLNKQYADGGGDYEEAVEEALKDAIENHQWSSNARARLLFLVLDAPPHHTANNVKTLHNVITKAAADGIRIIPVASSGVDKDTEALLRFFSISTGGTYVFLTNHSGIGNDHIEPTVGDYKVEFLNDLLVRVINEYTYK